MRPHRTVAHPGPKNAPAALGIARCFMALAAPAWVASCSLIYDLDGSQCSTDLDCSSKGGIFTDMVCVQNLCEPPTLSGCNNNVECIDAPDNFGAPAACIDRACIPMKTTECPVMLPFDDAGMNNLRSTNPLILGAFASIGQGNGPQVLNYNMALTEFTNEVEGLTTSSGARRNLVMMVCEGNVDGDRTVLDRGMAHLRSLKVPGVVSALFGDDLQYVFENGGLEANMFFMSPLEADPVLTILPDDGLVWHALPSADYIARAYAPLVERTLSYLNVSGTVRVASLIAEDIRFLSDVMETVRDPELGIKFNGMTVPQNTPDNYKAFTIVSEYTNEDATFNVQIQAILDFKPHIIIAAAAGEFFAKIVPTIERDWPVGAGEPPRPFYVLSPYQYNNPALDVLLATTPTIRTRMVGVNAAAAEDPSLYETYTGNWDQFYPEQAGVRGRENFYDAPYYLIYSAMAAGSVLETGQDLKRGMQRLLSGPEYDMGRSDLLEAYATLNLPRTTITLNGTMGPPDFDVPTGTRAAVGSVWCIDPSRRSLADVLRYDAASGQMTGTMETCIPGF